MPKSLLYLLMYILRRDLKISEWDDYRSVYMEINNTEIKEAVKKAT